MTISVFAENLGEPRFMAIADDGTLYVTDRKGRLLSMPTTAAGAVEPTVIASGLENPHGVTVHDGVLYVAETTRVSRVVDTDGDGVPDTLEPIIQDLPGGGHWSRTIEFGPDGKLYVSIGSSCNVCHEDDPQRAAIVRYNADGTGEELFATGLRNAVGIEFRSGTDELWATNNGRDGMGDDLPPETVNLVAQGANFGWPVCHAGDIVDPDLGNASSCEGISSPAVEMQAHSAPLGLAFYNSDVLGSVYRGSLFVAFHGSWNRSTPTGYKVVRLPFQDGRPTGQVIDFATGWLLPTGDAWGRPVDVAVGRDGSLYVSDDEGGRIFRITKES